MAVPVPPPSSSHHLEPRASITCRSVSPARHHPPRTLPPWIDSYEVRYGTPSEDQLRALSPPPPRTVPAHHNHSPTQPQRRLSRDGYVYDHQALLPLDAGRRPKVRLCNFIMRKDDAETGRKWDHLRSAEPVIVTHYSRVASDSRWRSYLQSSRYGCLPNEEAEIVDPEALDQLQPGFNGPVEIPQLNNATGRRATRTRRLYKRIWWLILQHPLIPLAFRLTVLLTSSLALALSAKIYEIEHSGEGDIHASEGTQSILAIVVDTVAIPYIGYMTWDEYTGKPLGLRPATQKISLVLMDLFFIIFKSASTALAFEALVYHNPAASVTREYSKALASFQLVGLISWSLTLTVNVFRLVQKLGGGEDEEWGWRRAR